MIQVLSDEYIAQLAFKKCGESMVQRQLSLKVGVGGITLLFAKLRYAFEEKLFFLPP